MSLHRGFLLSTAPRFHSILPWSERLEINTGFEAAARGTVPRSDWRRVSPEELQCLVAAEAAVLVDADAVLSGEHAGLFVLPSPLRREWWEAAHRLQEQPESDAFDVFVGHLVGFFHFKHLPLPPACAFEVRVSQPGLSSTREEAGAVGRAPGLAFGATPSGRAERVVAKLNVGDEATHLIFLNLHAAAMAALLAERGVGPMVSGEEDCLRRFAAAFPDYPAIRLRLEPGEGLWFPASGMAHDGDTMGKLELDVVLTMAVSGDAE